MTIRATRTAVAAISGVSAFLDLVMGASVLLLGKPQLFYLLAFLVAAQLFAIITLLGPTSLSLEGDELVFRRGGRVKHIPRSEVATCKQVGSSWVFSNSAGAQVLTLQMIRFADTDVAAFCGQAGIGLSGASMEPVDKLRREISAGKVNRAWGVIFAVVLLAATGGLMYWQLHVQDNLKRYEAAPACTQSAPSTSSCRLQTQARVTSVEPHAADTTVHLSLITSGADYIAAVDNPGPGRGDVVAVEVWDGEVTKVNGHDTARNPARDPNLNLNGAIAIPALFALIAVVAAAIGEYQVVTAGARLRAAAGKEAGRMGAVNPVRPDTKVFGLELPPCGVQHQPKETLFVHEDPKRMMSAIVITSVIAAVLLAGLVAGAIYISFPIFGVIAVLLLAFYAVQMISGRRELRFAGLYADDLHVGRITTDWIGRKDSRIFDRSSVLEVTVGTGKITVVGTDGSTLFWTTLVSPPDMERYAQFLGVRVIHEVSPAQQDSIAVPPVETPMGVLSLPVRRAAGIMQAFGGLFVGLAVVNLIRIPGAPADRRTILLVLLAALGIYGAILYVLGLLLARGRRHSRELAVFGGGAATAAFIVCWVVVVGNPVVAWIVGLLLVPLFGLAVYWLRPANQSK